MHTWIEISKSALINNLAVFRQEASPANVMPVIKSNAYGHGLKEVAEILNADQNIEWIGVNSLVEAEDLRGFGYNRKILIVGPTFESDFDKILELDVRFVLGHFHLLEAWLKLENPPVCHIKIDTGMSRQGFTLRESPAAASLIKSSKHGFDKVEAMSTHFANVEDVLEHDYANLQLAEFEEAVKVFKNNGFDGFTHAASSASTLLLPTSRFDLVRVGISLYGLWPSKATRLSYKGSHSSMANLKPVLCWKTKIAQIKDVEAGKYVGYGCSFRAQKDMKLAVLPVGYFEGLPRLASMKQSYVLVSGQRCSVVGRICMNMMMVDVTHIDNVKVEDTVVLLGRSKDETLSASDVAEWAETIHYELVTGINQSLERLIVE